MALNHKIFTSMVSQIWASTASVLWYSHAVEGGFLCLFVFPLTMMAKDTTARPGSGDLQGRTHALSGTCQLRHCSLSCCSPAGLPPAALCSSCLALGSACFLRLSPLSWPSHSSQLCLWAACAFLPSYFPMYSWCPFLGVSVCVSLRYTTVWAGISFLVNLLKCPGKWKSCTFMALFLWHHSSLLLLKFFFQLFLSITDIIFYYIIMSFL